VGYRFADSVAAWHSIFKGLEVQLGVENVFDTKPPVDVSAAPGTATNFYVSPFGDVRGVSYRLSLKRAF